MQPTITATLDAIREKLEQANTERNHDWKTGDILITLSLITEVLEAQLPLRAALRGILLPTEPLRFLPG